MEEGSCVTWRSYLWDIPRGVLKFAINAGLNTLPSLDNLKRWGKRVSDRCPLDRSLCRDMNLDPRIPPLFFQYHYEMMFWPIRMSIFDL